MTVPLRGEPISVPFTGRRLLERALVVVRFTPVLKIADESGSGIAAFQDAIRPLYPLAELEHEAMMRFEIQADGTVHSAQEKQPVWRISDIDKAWRVSLSARSISLETNGDNYSNWPDFAGRIGALVAAVAEHFEPSHTQYVGVRYLNAAPVGGDSDPRHDCARELVSITGNDDLEMADLLWRFRVDEGYMILRSGVMPPNGTYDPNLYIPRTEPNWYLDIDVANADTYEFEAQKINAAILAQVRRLHAVYLWAMKGEARN